jgi:UPF0271 protein
VFARQVAPLDPQAVATKVLRACQEGKVRTVEGADIDIEFSSVCLHSDTPGVLSLLQAVVARLQQAGITIAPPTSASPPTA